MENLDFKDFDYSKNVIEDDLGIIGDAFKIVFLGDIAVGKTNLMIRFVENDFCINSKATIGVDVANKPIRIGPFAFRLQLWDTSGQERYKSFSSTYFKDANGIIFVYDVTNKTSFKNMESWYELGRKGCDQTQVAMMLVGNKRDCVDKREVSQAEGEDFARKIGVPFFETSALDNSNDCVGRAFFALVTSQVIRHHSIETEERQQLRTDCSTE